MIAAKSWTRGRNWSWGWNAVQVIQRRTSQSIFYGPGVYVTLTLAFLAGAVVLHNTLRYVELNAVLSTREPLFLPIMISSGLVSLYLAVVASISAARERDRGTLEMLLYGPVDETSFILGHFVAIVKVYIVIAMLEFIWSNLVTWILHLAFSIDVMVLELTTIATVGAIVAFGLLVSVWGGRTRTALVYFILILLFFAALQIADTIVSGIAVSANPTENDPILLLRNVLAYADNLLQWVSPFSQLSRVTDDLLNGSLVGYLFHLGVTVMQALAFLAASVWALQRKGVRG
jgi:ABC-type transport system involved in multi-copper enzyme maturation permease subunit